jgi:hypothetical protein
MRRFWLFRSNLIPLEYYHQYTDLETFQKKCHDYYMLLPLWLLEKDYFDEVTIWRLTKEPKNPIVFNVNGKQYIQRWVRNFSQCFDYPSPEISFWRGGFSEYDQVTNSQGRHFGLKLYLGAGVRQFPLYGGVYDAFLMEDERDFKKDKKCIPFYKTASPYVFHPIKTQPRYDIIWPCNFTQIKYKGQEFFIKTIAQEPFLQTLRIAHCGNKPEVGKKLCKQYGVKNIEFKGLTERGHMNVFMNESKFGLNLSNKRDGCPRVSTEILMSGTPLILRDSVRLLNFYRKDGQGVINVNDKNLAKKIKWGLANYESHKNDVLYAIDNTLSFDSTNEKNIKEWQKI